MVRNGVVLVEIVVTPVVVVIGAAPVRSIVVGMVVGSVDVMLVLFKV
jgi:hypothetical protein